MLNSLSPDKLSFLFYVLPRMLLSFFLIFWRISHYSQPAITCSKLTIETLEQGMKYVQS